MIANKGRVVTSHSGVVSQGVCQEMYLAVLWICDKVFDADLGNDICISLKYASVNKGDFKEIIKEDK